MIALLYECHFFEELYDLVTMMKYNKHSKQSDTPITERVRRKITKAIAYWN